MQMPMACRVQKSLCKGKSYVIASLHTLKRFFPSYTLQDDTVLWMVMILENSVQVEMHLRKVFKQGNALWHAAQKGRCPIF